MDLNEALEAHRQLLNAHLDIWKTIQINYAQDDRVKAAVSKCLQRTEQMIQQCSSLDLSTITNDTHGPDKQDHKRVLDTTDDQPRHKKAKIVPKSNAEVANRLATASPPRHVPVTEDPSGLFLIDSNPGDLNILLKHAKIQDKNQKHQQPAKRHASDKLGTVPADFLDHFNSNARPAVGKQEKSGNSEVAQHPADGDEEYHRSFEQKVALRLKEKEEQRKKKANKKRKRESEASVEEVVPLPENEIPENEIKQKASKRRKAKLDTTAETATATLQKGNKRKKDKSGIQDKTDNLETPREDNAQQQKPNKKKRKKST